MSVRTRLKRLEQWAKQVAPKEDERQRRAALNRKLGGIPLEVLLLMREAMGKHLAETGKAGDRQARVRFDDLDLPEDLRQQLGVYLSQEGEAVGWEACYRPDEDEVNRAAARSPRQD